MLDERTHGLEIEAEPGEEPQQRRLHDRGQKPDLVFEAEAQNAAHQAKGDVREQPSFRSVRRSGAGKADIGVLVFTAPPAKFF